MLESTLNILIICLGTAVALLYRNYLRRNVWRNSNTTTPRFRDVDFNRIYPDQAKKVGHINLASKITSLCSRRALTHSGVLLMLAIATLGGCSNAPQKQQADPEAMSPREPACSENPNEKSASNCSSAEARPVREWVDHISRP